MRQIYGTSEGHAKAIGAADFAIQSACAEFDCRTWLSPRDLSGLAHNAVVASWPARVGSAAVQAVNAKRPIFNRQNVSVRFDGTDDNMSFPLDLTTTNQSSWILCVSDYAAVTVDVMLSYGAGPNQIIAYLNSKRFRYGGGAGTATFDKESDAVITGPKAIVAGRFSNAPATDVSDIWKVDASRAGKITVLRTNTSVNGAGNYAAGAGYIGSTNGGTLFLDAAIGEVILFAKFIPDTAWQEIIRHVAIKERLL